MNQKEINEYVLRLIEDEKKELAKSKVWEYGFILESTEPKKMGKIEALEKLGTWQAHIKSIENRIGTYQEYIKLHE